jgi:MerR family transcriptional regulator, redox-sensitive transcriptional activator SoxR
LVTPGILRRSANWRFKRTSRRQLCARVGGQRRYDDSIVARLEVIRLCKAAGFALDEIQLLFADDAPGRPSSRALAETKLAEIDARIAELQRAREIIEWGMRCTCPSIDDCTCGIHTAKPFNSSQ